MKRSKSIDPKAILDSIMATNYTRLSARCSWTGQPVKNVTQDTARRRPMAAQSAANFDLVITDNKSAPEIPVGGKLQLLS